MLVSFVACFLTHLPNLFVHSLDHNTFYLTNREAVNGLLVLRFVTCCLLQTILQLLVLEITSHFCLVESCLEPFVLTLAHMRVGDGECSRGLKELILNALNLMLLHFLGDSSAQVLWPI